MQNKLIWPYLPPSLSSAGASTKLSAAEFVRKVKRERPRRGGDYREASLKIHGWLCAKCGREFVLSELHLLTVHHKDGDHRNNPPDGSNWENLCVYCHDDEHSREILGAYMEKTDDRPTDDRREAPRQGGGFGTLGDLLKEKLREKGGGEE